MYQKYRRRGRVESWIEQVPDLYVEPTQFLGNQPRPDPPGRTQLHLAQTIGIVVYGSRPFRLTTGLGV